MIWASERLLYADSRAVQTLDSLNNFYDLYEWYLDMLNKAAELCYNDGTGNRLWSGGKITGRNFFVGNLTTTEFKPNSVAFEGL